MATSRLEKAILIGILLLALCCRTFLLDSVPPGFYSDEASNSYDAYSIMLTGRDRYDAPLPLYPRGFDYWKAGLHRLIIVPSINSFGLNEFGARFPSALAGVLTVLLTYLVVKMRFRSSTALWAALLLAISPWHVHLSRSCTEYVFLPFFFMLGLYLFLLGLERNKFYLYLSATAFAFTFYTYIPARLFVPLSGLGLLFIYREELSKHKRAVGSSLIIFLLLLIPSILFALREPDHFFLQARYNQIGVTSGERSYAAAILVFIKNYLSHLSPVFLFFKGDANIRNFPQGFGQLYLFEFPLVILGIAACIRKRGDPDTRFLIFWLLTYSIAASLTTEGIPHGLRVVTSIPLFQILSAIGIHCISVILKRMRGLKRWLFRIGAYIFIALAAANVMIFFHHYFLYYSVYSAHAWDYGWREAIEYAGSVEDDYDRIVLTVLSSGPPTMYPPFYLRYDPEKYQRSGLEETKYRFVTPEIIGALFVNFKGKTLYLVREEELRYIAPKKVIYFPDGRIAFKIIEKLN